MSKMVGAGALNSDFMDTDFWTKFPKKMTACKAYQKRKIKKENEKTDEEKELETRFYELLKENGITYRMRSAKG